MSFRSLSFALVLALLLPLAGGLLAGAQDMPVAKIGIMVPLTGAYGADAEDVVQAAQIAVDDLNEAGGVAGYTLELVIADTVDQRADAVTTAFNQLSNTEDLNFIMTAYASTSNFEIDLMAEVDMPYLISANAAQTRDIVSADPENYHTVWSRVPSYDAYETALPELLEAYDEAGLLSLRDREAFIISSDDPYGTTIATGMRAHFESLGWSIVGYETVPVASVTDWRGLLAKVRENEPDILVVTDSAPPNNAALMNQFMENPPNSLLFLQYGPSVQEFLDLTGDNSTGLIYNNLGAAIDSKSEVIEIRDRYEENVWASRRIFHSHRLRSGHDLCDLPGSSRRCERPRGDRRLHWQLGNGNAGWFLDL